MLEEAASPKAGIRSSDCGSTFQPLIKAQRESRSADGLFVNRLAAGLTGPTLAGIRALL